MTESTKQSTRSGLSGSIDVVVVGGLLAGAGKLLESQAIVAIGIAVLVLGTLKVAYDHLTGFEDPLGIEEWAER